MPEAVPETLVIAGENTTRIWGLSNRQRIERMAGQAGVGGPGSDGSTLWVDQGYAFDPLWMHHAATTPRLWVMAAGRPVMVRDDQTNLPAEPATRATPPADATVYELEAEPTLYNLALRKQQRPFFEPLNRHSVRRLERESYYGAYKGITDLLTKYLWPELALHLTRLAARLRITPNMVTLLGALLCVLAIWAFWRGDYWAGVATGFVFMVLDTVDGKLARCTITSSWWGNIFDHGIDLIHPPIWWIAWAMGLAAWGLAYDPETFRIVIGTILIGYVGQRLVEGWFLRRFGFHIHVWRKVDSDFRLIAARRNPNMIPLVGALIVGRPDIGLILVAWWTAISLVVHLGQIVTAELDSARGRPIRSWLEAEP